LLGLKLNIVKIATAEELAGALTQVEAQAPLVAAGVEHDVVRSARRLGAQVEVR